MSEHITKATLHQSMQQSYTQLDSLLASLTPEQLITPGVNGKWSIKDNLAHITDWIGYILQLDQAVFHSITFVNPYANQEDDEINEVSYQAAKDLSYTEVRSRFQQAFQHLLNDVEVLSEDQLNAVPAGASRVLGLSIFESSVEHLQEHRELIENWLKLQTL